jgi:hypothetical protein
MNISSMKAIKKKRQSAADLYLQRSGFHPGLVDVRFLVEELTLYFGISVFSSHYHHLKATLITQRRG